MKKISISGEIGWETTARDLKSDLERAGGEDVEVTISSPGGYVSDALEMFNLLRNYSGHVTAILSGYAMSAASYIPLAADKVIAEDNAVYMIHNVQGGVWGDHNDIIHYGEMCKNLSAMLTKAYAKFSGNGMSELEKMMDETTYFFGDQIVEAGFAHETIGVEGEQDKETNMSVAKLKFQEVSAKLVDDQKAMKKDLNRASVMALGEIKKAVITPQKEDSIMDLKELKAKHPDLVAAIIEEATAGHADAITTARADGVSTESERIKNVHAQMFPGHEEIVNTAMFDGKSQAGDVAMAINAANIKAQAKAGDDMSDDAPDSVDEQLDGPPKAKKVDKDAPIEERAKAEWDNDKDLRAEFADNFDNYLAFEKANGAGQIKVLGHKE